MRITCSAAAGCVVTFDRDEFITECLAALRESDVIAAVAEIVQRRVDTGAALDDAFPDRQPGPLTLYSSPDLTVQRIEWSPGFQSAAHDHRMWAVVGVYSGSEHNRFHRRVSGGLDDVGGRVLDQGDVLVLDADAIHSVTNPSRSPVAGLHVYGGDIDGVPRSQWRPDGTEGPLAEVRAEYQAMWDALRDYAREQLLRPTDSELYDAFSEINRRVADRRRILSRDDVRAILATLWKV
jgi:predicted metal-dependent enzyme (double-stranded beta helix superfamily)